MMKKISKETVVSAFKGNARNLATELNITLPQAYHLIKKYDLKIVSMREQLLNALNEIQDIDLLESKLGISKNRIYSYLKEIGLKLPKRSLSFQCRVSKTDLEYLYENHTTDEIGKIYGVSRQTVCNWMNGYEIKKRTKGRYPILDRSLTKENLIKLYSELGSIRLIAEKVGLKTSHINRLVREYNIDLDFGPKPKIEDNVFIKDYGKYNFDELAKKYGVHKITIFRKARKLGLSKKSTFNITKEFCEQNKHRVAKDIAKELGCSIALINATMRKYGVQRK